MNYQIIENLCIEDGSGSKVKLYGVMCFNKTMEPVFRFHELTSQKHLVLELIDLCVNGDVTEVTIGDIIEDFIISL